MYNTKNVIILALFTELLKVIECICILILMFTQSNFLTAIHIQFTFVVGNTFQTVILVRCQQI